MRTLSQVPVGETVKVSRIQGMGALQRRMMDLGVLKGVSVFVRKVAPFGDPIEINVRGYELSLRKVEAEVVAVE
jgi:ferrous iron transport protein A